MVRYGVPGRVNAMPSKWWVVNYILTCIEHLFASNEHSSWHNKFEFGLNYNHGGSNDNTCGAHLYSDYTCILNSTVKIL